MDIKQTNIYDNLEEFPIYNFNKCLKGDLKFMFLSRRGEVNEEINNKWSELYNEYCELTNSSESITYNNLVLEVKWLQTRLVFVPNLIELFIKTPIKERKDILKELKKWKSCFRKEEDVDKALKQLKNSENKIKRKLQELEDIKNKNKELKEMTIQKQAIKIKRALGINVDIFKDSVVTWISYFNEIEELNNKKPAS